MTLIKSRKIGNSVGIIFPKESGLIAGQTLEYRKEGTKIIIDTYSMELAKARELIEKDFEQIEEEMFVAKEVLNEKYGKYGWGKSE